MSQERRGGSPGFRGRGAPYEASQRRTPAHSTIPVASSRVNVPEMDTSGSADTPVRVRDVPLLHLGGGDAKAVRDLNAGLAWLGWRGLAS